MMKIATHLGIALACAEAVLVTAATAQLPDPLDTWITPLPCARTFVQFGVPRSPAVPADIFGPGSDPFVGQVDFIGEPIDPANLGSTSTLIQRAGDPVLPGDPVGAMGTVPIEIVALSLRSASPITVTFNGGQNPEEWDVEVVDLSQVTPPMGTMTATKTHANGCTFDAVLHVQARFTFTEVAGPGVGVLDTGVEGIPHNQLVIGGASFVHAVNPALGVIVQPGALFVPGVVEVIPGDQKSQVQSPFVGDDPGVARHTFCAPKEPTGACCIVDGTCNVETSGDCNILGGRYQGDGSNCSPNNCPAPSPGDIAGPLGPGFPDGCVDAFDLAALLNDWCSVAGGNPCGTCFAPP